MQVLDRETKTSARGPEELDSSFVWIPISHLIDSDYLNQYSIDILIDPETGEAPTNHYRNVPSDAKGLVNSALRMTLNYAENPQDGHKWQRQEYNPQKVLCTIEEEMPASDIPACIIRNLKPHDGYDAEGEPWREPLNTSVNRLVALRELRRLLPSPPAHIVPILEEVTTAWLDYKISHGFSLPEPSEEPLPGSDDK